MKIGISSYCLNSIISDGTITLFDAIDWAAENGAECMELVPFAFKFEDDDGNIKRDYIKQVKSHAKDAGVELVNYSILADFCSDDREVLKAAIERVKHHVDIAAELEVPRMRHDVTAFRRPRGENNLVDFDRLLPQLTESALCVTEYAAKKGVVTLLENHGFFANGCDRVERLMNAVNHPNYRLLLDTGNIACVDEDPTVASVRLAKYADMIHLKDFYIRKREPTGATEFDCAGNWFRSMAGRFLRGSILGQGDLDMPEIAANIIASGYDGNIAIEFEGMEEPRMATKFSLQTARMLFGREGR